MSSRRVLISRARIVLPYRIMLHYVCGFDVARSAAFVPARYPVENAACRLNPPQPRGHQVKSVKRSRHCAIGKIFAAGENLLLKNFALQVREKIDGQQRAAKPRADEHIGNVENRRTRDSEVGEQDFRSFSTERFA